MLSDVLVADVSRYYYFLCAPVYCGTTLRDTKTVQSERSLTDSLEYYWYISRLFLGANTEYKSDLTGCNQEVGFSRFRISYLLGRSTVKGAGTER